MNENRHCNVTKKKECGNVRNKKYNFNVPNKNDVVMR